MHFPGKLLLPDNLELTIRENNMGTGRISQPNSNLYLERSRSRTNSNPINYPVYLKMTIKNDPYILVRVIFIPLCMLRTYSYISSSIFVVTDFGLSRGCPNALAQTRFAVTPNARPTPNKTV